jgi:molybdate transport system substrate-binding protein
MQARGVWETLSGRIVQGETISQAYQYVKTGAAELGFVAWSQLKRPDGGPIEGSWWEIPSELYSPIEQQAVLLKDAEPARAFLEFLRSDEARRIIRGYGYETP